MSTQPTRRRTFWLRMATFAALAAMALPLTQLASAKPPADGLPAEKQRIEDQYERERIAGKARPAVKAHQQGPAATVADQKGRPTGIVEHGAAPFSAKEFAIQNQWQQQVNGVWVTVYAGALTDDPEQGVVLVASEGPLGAADTVDRYPTPDLEGALRIVAEDDLHFTLETAYGWRLIFDLATRTFRPA